MLVSFTSELKLFFKTLNFPSRNLTYLLIMFAWSFKRCKMGKETSSSKKKSSESSNPKPSSSKSRKRKSRRRESYKNYIFKVLEKNYPGQEISKSSLKVMNSFILDIFNGVANEASKLAQMNNSRSVTTFEIQEAVKLLLPGELAKTAITRGQQAVNNSLDNESTFSETNTTDS